MVLEGTIAEYIVKLEPAIYRKYILHNDTSKPMLYIQLKKALYGTTQKALLFWKLLSVTLIEWGLTNNPYYQFVENMINR